MNEMPNLDAHSVANTERRGRGALATAGRMPALPKQSTRPDSLVFQRNHRLVILAEGRYSGQATLGFGDVHDRAIAVDCVTIRGEEPFPPLAGVPCRLLYHRRMGGRSDPRDGQ